MVRGGRRQTASFFSAEAACTTQTAASLVGHENREWKNGVSRSIFHECPWILIQGSWIFHGYPWMFMDYFNGQDCMDYAHISIDESDGGCSRMVNEYLMEVVNVSMNSVHEFHP